MTTQLHTLECDKNKNLTVAYAFISLRRDSGFRATTFIKYIDIINNVPRHVINVWTTYLTVICGQCHLSVP